LRFALPNHLSLTRQAYLVFLLCLGFCLSVTAGGKQVFSPADDKSKHANDPSAENAESDNDAMQQTLNLNFSPEHRERIRKTLEDYARSVDPEHDKIEERRRTMQQNIESRFFNADNDNDGTLDRQETTENLPQIARHFSSVDINQDGVISLTELTDAQNRILERRKAAEAALEAEKQQKILEQSEPPVLPKRKGKQASPNGLKKQAR